MTEYLIKKDHHYPNKIHWGITFSNKMSYKIRFDESCLYDLHNVDNYDINKLFGFSTSWNHMRQSGRIGWRCLDGKTIQICTYTHNNGMRQIDDSDVLGNVLPGELFYCDIVAKKNKFVYTFRKATEKEETIRTDTKNRNELFIHYLLHVYFGGNEGAPHEMKIFMEKI